MSSRFTELFGCARPVQLASMSGIADVRLAAAVSNAGGLGMLGVGRRGTDELGSMIDAVLEATQRPVGAGFVVELADRDSLALAAERLPVVECFYGWPDPDLVPDQPTVGWQVGSADEAKAAVDAGCRYVVAQGIEAGGHVRGAIELADLIGDVRDAVGDDVVVLAAGGIGTATDVRGALSCGADGVRVGTRFVAAAESPAHDRYVELLSDASDLDTELSEAFWVGWPAATHRVLTSAVEASGDAPDVLGTMPTPAGRRKVPRFFVSPPTLEYDGLIDAMALYAGTGSTGAVRGRIAAADLIDELLGDIG